MKLELSFHASGLSNVAGAFKGTSDPFAVVTQLQTGQKPQVLGKTEVIKNTLSPQWTKVFVVDYELGKPAKVVVSLFDEVRKGDNKAMGSAMFDIGAVLGARGSTQAKKMKDKKGMLVCHARQAAGSGLLRLKLAGMALKNTEGFLRKSDPFFELSRKIDAAGAATWDNVFRSNVVNDNLSPAWNEAQVELSVLCGGDLNLPVLLRVFDYESSGKHVLMGQLETSVNGLVQAANSNAAMVLKVKNKETGKIQVTKAEVSGVTSSGGAAAPANDLAASMRQQATISSSPPPPSVSNATFVDYIAGGCQLNVVIGIDFTGSNGDPRQRGTLHHIDGNSYNDYEKALSAIVGILSKYDHDQLFPVLGFGAKFHGVVNHCFQVGPKEEARGLPGVLNSYRSVFDSGVVLSAPTVFTEVMQTAAARARSAQEAAQRRGEQAYTILLILTDGAVSDAPATARCLEQISDAPLSVVIVGVGQADFASMRFLDDVPHVKRDIAQFVAFNEHAKSAVDLTSATLHEIPTQLVGYFQSRNIAPLSPQSVKASDIAVVADDDEPEIDLSVNISGEDDIVVTGSGAVDDFADGFQKKY